jgi:hypothetical protein
MFSSSNFRRDVHELHKNDSLRMVCLLFAKLKRTARRSSMGSQSKHVFETARAVDHAFDDDTRLVDGEPDRITMVNGLGSNPRLRPTLADSDSL